MFWYASDKMKYQKVCISTECKMRYTTTKEREVFCERCKEKKGLNKKKDV